ncbi:hypothetical protein GOV12_04890 [Candidatus Pacearchaeota archaeon]|nr:hypothetical protein [Candidatus Pacearchaeota archaeon]
MKNKAILVLFMAIFAMVLTTSAVLADDFVEITKVKVNGITLAEGTTYVGQVSDTVPIDVEFSSSADVKERVKIKAYIEDFRDDIEQSVTLRTPLEDGVSGYVARLSLKLPSTLDIDDFEEGAEFLSEDTTLNIRISAQGEDTIEQYYTIRMQRDLYSLNILSVESISKVTAGSVVPMSVVLQNNGNQRLDNVYVKASIPELGIERKVYFGDLDSDVDDDYDEIRDVTERNVYLTVPRNSVPGTYNVEIEAYNYDTSVTTTKRLVIAGIDSGVLPGSSAKTIAPGEETTFEVVLVNPNDRMIIYSLTPEESTGLLISIAEPIASVSADSSRTVDVNVKATDSAEEGTHLVTVNVNTESGLEKQVSFSVNIEADGTTSVVGGSGTSTTPIASGVLILTVILVIIFVVLLIVLIVLLTRKPAETEEFGETSYY